MKTRIITGIILGLVFIPAVIFGGIYYTILALILSAVGTYELMNMFYTKSPTLKYLRYVVPAFSVILTALLFKSEKTFIDTIILSISDGKLGTIIANSESLYLGNLVLVLFAYILFVIILMIVNIFIKGTGAHDILSCILSLTYGGLMLGSALTIEFVRPITFEGQNIWGGQLFAYCYLVITFTDIFAYFIGCKFGKHRLCPNISPKKSVEGAIGGLVFGSVFGTLCAYLFGILPITSESDATEIVSYLVIAFFISIVLSIVGQIGDLVASKLKRTYEIKDYGTLFPGHGGVMDRFDSLILSGSFIYVFILLFRLITLGVI